MVVSTASGCKVLRLLHMFEFSGKLKKPRANKSVRANSFALRNIPASNSLPTDTVHSKTVVEFKTKLDKIWHDRRYNMDR